MDDGDWYSVRRLATYGKPYVRYQFPGPDHDPDITSNEIIQQFCEQALGFDAGLQIEFDPEDGCFDVFELLDEWEEDGNHEEDDCEEFLRSMRREQPSNTDIGFR